MDSRETKLCYRLALSSLRNTVLDLEVRVDRVKEIIDAFETVGKCLPALTNNAGATQPRDERDRQPRLRS